MRYKTFIRLVTAMLIIATIVAAVVFFNVATPDERFIRSANRGMVAGWEKSEPESTLRNVDLETDITFIEEEYAAVRPFRHSKFRDEGLGAAAAEYIEALEECHKAIKENDPADGFNTFWKSFSEPYGRRIRAIYNLEKGNYGFLEEIPDSYIEDKEELLLQGWALIKTETIAFDRAKGNKKNELTAKVTNDSGHDLDFIELAVDLYDKEGKLAETATVYESDIKKGKDVVLHCYETVEGRTHEYVVKAINCEMAD